MSAIRTSKSCGDWKCRAVQCRAEQSRAEQSRGMIGGMIREKGQSKKALCRFEVYVGNGYGCESLNSTRWRNNNNKQAKEARKDLEGKMEEGENKVR
jgi:hypothetical protein